MKVIKIRFTGRTEGKVFDTTSQKEAEKAGIKKEGVRYGPITISIGKGEIIKGLEEALQGMKEGEEKKIVLGPEKAFGQRKKELVGLVSKKEFVARKLSPVPGMIVEINNMYGRVQSVSGGRVRVDFNNELAGKTVEYKVKLEKELDKPGEIVNAFAEKYFPQTSLEARLEKGELKAKLGKKALAQKNLTRAKQAFNNEVFQALKDVKKISFLEEYERQE